MLIGTLLAVGQALFDSVLGRVTPTPPTATLISTPTPDSAGTLVALEATLVLLSTSLPTIAPEASLPGSLGNADVYPFYDDQVSFPDVMIVELQLILKELAITPTPYGDVTLVPANTDVARPTVRSTVALRETPRPARIENTLEGVPPFIIAELQCSEIAFKGCQEDPVRSIELRGINQWRWRVQSIIEQPSRQSLSILFYAADAGGSKKSNTPIYRHNFDVMVVNPSRLIDLIETNIGSIIAGICGIIGVVLGGMLAIWKLVIERRVNPSFAPKDAADLRESRIFVSYRRGVSWGIAKKIADDLENLGATVFIDVDDIHEGKWEPQIKEHIERCDYFVVILAPRTLESEWVCKEIQYANERDKVIIPVLVDGFDFKIHEIPEVVKNMAEEHAIRFAPDYYEAAFQRLAQFVQPKKRK